MIMGRLSSPSPEAAHKQANLQGRNLDMAPMGYMETLSSVSGRGSMSNIAWFVSHAGSYSRPIICVIKRKRMRQKNKRLSLYQYCGTLRLCLYA